LFVLALGVAGCAPVAECPPGVGGCACLESGACRLPSLACAEGRCVVGTARCEGGACIPAEPRCWSPCDNDLWDEDGRVHRCEADGLIEGCVGDLTCDQGSCVPPDLLARGPVVHACEGDACVQRFELGDARLTEDECRNDPRCCLDAAGCPDHQVCIRGGCYSDCDADGDCSVEGARCVKHACRLPCAADTADARPCPSGQGCEADGWCRPTVAGDAPLDLHAGDFTVHPGPGGLEDDDPVTLWLRPSATSSSFEIRNSGRQTEPFLVRKATETVVDGEGRVQVRRASREESPLAWLELGRPGATNRVDDLLIYVPAAGSVLVEVAGARRDELGRWQGVVEIVHDQWGVERVHLVYNEGLSGRWLGSAYYFGDFPDGTASCTGDCPIERWMAGRQSLEPLEETGNAFVKAWARFRRGAYSLVDLGYLTRAMLDGSWAQPRTRELCAEAGYGPDTACALAPAPGGRAVIPFTSDVTRDRIPSGLVELPLSLVLEPEPEPGAVRSCLTATGEAPTGCLRGRIETRRSLQYPGDAQVTLRVEETPEEACGASGPGSCLVGLLPGPMADLSAGARYVPAGAAGCPSGFSAEQTPWLPPGLGPPGAGAARVECRDAEVPLGPAVDRREVENASLAGANPVPDGQVLRRRLELVDGVIVEQGIMLLLLRERIGTGGWSYAYAVLQRQDAQPGEAEGQPPGGPSSNRGQPERAPACPPELLRPVLGLDGVALPELPAAWAERLARALVRGDTRADGDPPPPGLDPDEEPHWLCSWEEDDPEAGSVLRQVFDGRSLEGDTVPCPPGSDVIWFTLLEAAGPGDPSLAPCNSAPFGTCLGTLRGWVSDGTWAVRLTPADETRFFHPSAKARFDLGWECEAGRLTCDDERADLASGKEFFLVDPTSERFFEGLDRAVASAFRYRTELTGPSGASVGFVPEICQGEASLLPYCYDPPAIERVRARVDCAAALYDARFLAGSVETESWAATAATLRGYLERNAAVRQSDNPFGDPIPMPGFERLYAELLLALGDEALTQAFAGRFDLAGTRLAAFEGSLFEPGGVDLTGAAGHELFELHQAIQYFELVLDRYQRQLPQWRDALAAGAGYVSSSTLTDYVTLVVGASTRLTQAWSEVARRYEALDRPDLARRVLERAYARAYLESRLLATATEALARGLPTAARAQASRDQETAQLRYRVALLEMRDRYDRIGDGPNLFGFSPDYVPLPALEELETSPVAKLLAQARAHAEAAAADEDRALARSRSFDLDEAEFQQELVGIRQTYEERLGALCGTLHGDDGRVYPALPRYTHLNAGAAEFLDPCGALGTGEIAATYADLQTAQLALKRIDQQQDNLLGKVEASRGYADSVCQWRWADPDDAGAYPDGITPGSPAAGSLGKKKALDDINNAIGAMKFGIGVANDAISLVMSVEKGAWALRKRIKKRAKAQAKAEKKALAELLAQSPKLAAMHEMAQMMKDGSTASTSKNIPASVLSSFLTAGLITHIPEPAIPVAFTIAVVLRAIHLVVNAIASTAFLAVRIGLGIHSLNERAEIRRVAREQSVMTRYYTCAFAQLESSYSVAALEIEATTLALDSLDALWNVEGVLAELATLDNERRRLEDQWSDDESLAVHVAAARDDPNVRVLRNDAIINADASFRRALRSAFRATRALEYHAAESYAGLERLLLVRTVRAGQDNVLRYLDGLEDRFYELQEQAGPPDTRVLVRSLRDDLLDVPRYSDTAGMRPLSHAERVEEMRRTLRSAAYRDGQGRISVPFSTDLDGVSPRTWGHKVLSVEATLVGPGRAAAGARLYLVQDGVGLVRNAAGDRRAYALPPVNAVVDAGPLAAGDPPAGSSVPAPLLRRTDARGLPVVTSAPLGLYRRSFRFRDRPLVNSGWRLVIDLVGEPENGPLRLGGLDDVVLRFTYTDYTAD